MPRRCPLNSRCPLFRASVKGGSTVIRKDRNEQRSRDAAAKKRANTSGVGENL